MVTMKGPPVDHTRLQVGRLGRVPSLAHACALRWRSCLTFFFSSPCPHVCAAASATDFSAPIWRRAAVLLVAGVAFYKFNQSFGLDETDEDRRPWLTRYLAYNQPPRQVWIDHEEKHLELARDRAATKLFLQDAEHPPIQRLRANA